MDRTLQALKSATSGTPYEGRLYLVGGIVRDAVMGLLPGEDIDLVLEGDAVELAAFLYKHGVGEHSPVTFPRFGTACLTINGHQVEFVGARKESYDPSSRKPSTRAGSLLDDILRRDFTINTLLQNLHSGEIIDLIGQGHKDIEDKIIRTPVDPLRTFDDDPLRMLRAVRFASRLGFSIHPETYSAIKDRAPRLSIVSAERIREEFTKILMNPNASVGLETLRETGLLDRFAPELSVMYGVTQNIYHIYDVWTHTLKTLELIPAHAGMILRMTALLHDVGKVPTRSVDENGQAHFYNHHMVGAQIARNIMNRLRFSNIQTDEVAFLISMHLRVGEYDSGWSDAAVRRLLRDAGDRLENLITLTTADKATANPEMPSVDLEALRSHIGRVKAELAGNRIESPLNGSEIIETLGTVPGPKIGEIKEFLETQVVEGRLLPGDKAAARQLVLRIFGVEI